MSEKDMLLPRPRDSHDERLIRNVRPSGWVNPPPQDSYNLIVIGAGTAGLVSALGAAGLGATVAVLEERLIGGDCLNFGCVPSKALLSSARAVSVVRNASDFGAQLPPGDISVDFPAVMERMRRLRAEISNRDSVTRLSEAGIDVFLGSGEFTGPNRIRVGDEELRFKRAVIAVGATSNPVLIPQLQGCDCLTNETLFSLTDLPPRLGIIGAGRMGCEMAQAFRRFGSQVYLFESSPRILGQEDIDAAQTVQDRLVEEGVVLFLDTRVERVSSKRSEKIVEVGKGDAQQEVIVDEVLVAVGRTPLVDGLGLERAGVAYSKISGVEVNEYLQTSNSRIYAAGDVCSNYKFTHMADAAARIVLRNALFKGSKKASTLTVPWCVYTDPEIAQVGLTESEARNRGIEFETFLSKLSEVDRAVLDDTVDGFVKIHVKKGSDRILGATIVAKNAGNMISEITLAIVEGIGLRKLADVIRPYPTESEAIRRAGDLCNKKRLTPLIRGLLSRWLNWAG